MSIKSRFVCVCDACGREDVSTSYSGRVAMHDLGKKGWVNVKATPLGKDEDVAPEFILCDACHRAMAKKGELPLCM